MKLGDRTERNPVPELFEFVFEQEAMGMALRAVDPHNSWWLRVNQKFCDMLGYSREELLQLTSVDISMPDEQHLAINYNEQLLRGDLSSYSREKRYLRKDGTTIWTNIWLSAVLDPDGNPIQIISVIEDINDRKLMEMTLQEKEKELELALVKEQELNKLQREFVSMASHEFRTPLAIIDATAQRMKSRADKNKLTPDDAVKRVEKIRDAVKRMIRLMDSMLDAARMEEGKINVTVEPCDISKLVQEVCECQQEMSKAHVISCDLADLPETIQADTGSVERVITNLLSNAVKYAPDAPDIEVKGHAEGDQVVISVRDHGVGIDGDELERIGERFFRAQTSTGIAGTGIGLNLVKKLVEMHGGSLSVESKKSEGSTFTIRLPIDGLNQSEQADTKVA